ncbi:oligosaccharide flippase family protein [Venenivibrio stagnispumantis]|uniref:Membrane protein involved in the export of O-antigen and teichoic acid n=1 Tax=Venenivibrio stagnispumantis TaxID=407998 RepID=A0AA45WNI7_9AQUI|nr:oligosaccharide flippase family protein [Venenivibrio stagnispumantis]MCW4573205.1 oligosaccharide flippase family protein [Venenivibrio stagnispumantis]SMP17401.1 Membrane protein involved in the export of O-antigen and teichoic acid [Venenivibrio stagnispumantis]
MPKDVSRSKFHVSRFTSDASRLLPKSEFTRNVLTLMTGTTIAQAIPIAISPILTRLYTPEDFGVFALFMAIVSIFGTIANGRYELAIMLPKKDEDAINIFALGFIINVVISLTLLIIILIFHDYILKLLNNKEISPWLYFVPLTVFLMGIFNLLNYFNNRMKQYKDLAKANVYKSIAGAIAQLSLGFLKAGALGLISGQIISQMVSNTKLFINVKKLNLFNHVYKIKIIANAKKYKKLPLYNLPNAILDGLRESIINILINTFYSVATLGQFSLGRRMVQFPSSLIGSSISQVFFQKISNAKESELYNIVKNFILKTILFFSPIFLIIYIFAPFIFSIVFGEKWKLAGQIASFMTPWIFLNFITSPLSTIFIRLNLQEILLIFAVFYNILPILTFFFLKTYDFLFVIKMLSLGMSFLLFIFIIIVLIITKSKEVLK